ncbi:MAG: Zn-dependent hydrolase [Pseudomonadota bacterium]
MTVQSHVRNLSINGDRLWDSLMAMAKIGKTAKDGVCRLALTDLDRESRDLFIAWCKAEGCSVRIDKMGNIFARREGKNPDLPPVVMGSHLDSQPTGGKYDGVYGVLAGLEVVRTLNEAKYETESPLEVVCWTNEEGSRFAPAMVASGVFAKVFDLDYGHSRADVDGKTMGEELKRIGYMGEDDPTIDAHPMAAYFEAHIEQGPILEDEGKDIGIVTDAQGQRWYEITLTGVEAHAGPTPMTSRKDALLGAARIIDIVNKIGLKRPLACATVGMMQIHPNSRNVIPGRVFFTVDFRHPDDAVLADMDTELRREVARVTSEIGLDCALDQIFYYAPVPFDASCVDAVRRGVEIGGFSARDIVSGAGHDACYLAQVCPTAMIFIPCVDGISHNEIEEVHKHWSDAGGQVLLHAVLVKADETVLQKSAG